MKIKLFVGPEGFKPSILLFYYEQHTLPARLKGLILTYKFNKTNSTNEQMSIKTA